jgi:hypothetical protein
MTSSLSKVFEKCLSELAMNGRYEDIVADAMVDIRVASATPIMPMFR